MSEQSFIESISPLILSLYQASHRKSKYIWRSSHFRMPIPSLSETVYSRFIPGLFPEEKRFVIMIYVFKHGFFRTEYSNNGPQENRRPGSPRINIVTLIFGYDPPYHFLQLFYPVWFRNDVPETVFFIIAHNRIA